jgi:hypothetical protein
MYKRKTGLSPIPVSGRFANPVSSFGKANEIQEKQSLAKLKTIAGDVFIMVPAILAPVVINK